MQALPGFLLVLLLDCASSHLCRSFIQHAQQIGVRLCFVPASLTWALQPLDVRYFAALKRRIRLYYQVAILNQGHNNMPTMTLLKVLIKSAQETLCSHKWRHVFSDLGILDFQKQVSGSTCAKLGFSSTEEIHAQLQTHGVLPYLAHLPPRNRRVDWSLFDWLPQAQQVPSPPSVSSSPRILKAGPWQNRLRPRK